MRSIACSRVASASTEAIATRGTITSCTRRSPSSMTALIICSSSASRTPCSPPRSTMRRSSSALIAASWFMSTPIERVTQRVMPLMTATSGPRARASQSIGRARTSANRSGLASAIDFGISSAKTIVNSARMMVTATRAVPPAAAGSMPSRSSRPWRPSTRLTAANAEAKKPIIVSPIWATARNRPGSSMSLRTRRALGRPSSTSWSMRLRRTDTRAISAATKKPSRKVRKTRNRISPSGKLMSSRSSRGMPRRWARPALPVARGSVPAPRPRACRAARPS